MLIFVMAILGVLFITGISFMSMMNFESRMIDAEKQRVGTTPRVGEVLDDIGLKLGEDFEKVSEPINVANLLDSHDADFAALPGVHNFFSPIEPYRQAQLPHDMVYPWFTDPLALLAKNDSTKTWAFKDQRPDTLWTSGLDPQVPSILRTCGGLLAGTECTNDLQCTPDTCEAVLLPVDADGDGIVDGMEVDIDNFDIPKSQYRALSKLLNPISKPDGRVYLGLRVIPHGGMINVNDSAPTLLANVLDVGDDSFNYNHHPPYSPQVEEAALRRRNFLPANTLPATRLQGNPLKTEDPSGVVGDYAVRLFAPKEDLWKHRFWPFGSDEIDTAVDPARPIWSIRMDPDDADDSHPFRDQYDRRHLVTTISHDDLLHRDTLVTLQDPTTGAYEQVSVYSLMVKAIMATADPNSSPPYECPADLPFEYPLYPYGLLDAYHMKNPPIPPNPPLDFCQCYSEPGCTLNPRKGKLRLSLPWIQEQLNAGSITKDQEIRLIQDAFTLQLLNARGPEWGYYESIDVDGDGIADVPTDIDIPPDGILDPVAQRWVPYDTVAGGPPGCSPSDMKCENPVAWTAAALTANLIDFADNDDLPTEVQLRSADYTNLTKFGIPINKQYVYGLERQPFITEVVARASSTDLGGDPVLNPPTPWPTAGWDAFFGVELFNPYDKPISLLDYGLRIYAANLAVPMSLPLPNSTLNKNQFVGFWGGEKGSLGSTVGRDLEEVKGNLGERLWFDETSTIQLMWYPPGTGLEIVVDEVDLSNQPVPTDKLGFWDSKLRSSQRIASPGSPWTAPVPVAFDDPNAVINSSNIGLQYARTLAPGADPIRPVAVEFANSGPLNEAFPTTGSLLLLMRYANSVDYNTGVGQAFTSYLTRFYDDILVYDSVAKTLKKKIPSVDSRVQIDNGRMPVFDPGGSDHIDPGVYEPIDPSKNVPPAPTKDRPGDLEHLPWGQLIFDYFTALPLHSDGPYASGTPDDHAPPRVDLGGLRVSGRININAAPWKVLSGLPFVPMDEIPASFRNRFRTILYGGSPPPDTEAQPIGDALAKAIVAFRELRSIDDPGLPNATGQYGESSMGLPDPNGRDWQLGSPAYRRGMGLMTAGELANVRHSSATGTYRIDAGTVGSAYEDYLDAIAILASMGDWVTVRSQVFTIYGSMRGEPDGDLSTMTLDEQKKALGEVNSRALRFEETIDRLPTYLGNGKPARIGDRSISAYNEVLHD